MQEYEIKNTTDRPVTEGPYMLGPMDVCCFMTGKGIRIREDSFEVVYLNLLGCG